jgi:enoyl-CoA hydratase
VIRAAQEGAVTVVTIDRPERRNAVNAEMCEQLTAAVQDGLAAGTRAIVLTGAGGHFCAGADLTGVEDEHFRKVLAVALRSLCDAPVATVAAVEGAALGAGMQLAAACDLRVATPGARFGIPAAKLGLMVDHWTVRRVVRMVGEGPARAMLSPPRRSTARARCVLGWCSGRAGSTRPWRGRPTSPFSPHSPSPATSWL